MAVPKKRKSKARTRQRRAQHDKIAPPAVSYCPQCNEPVAPHHVCLNCGYYRHRSVIDFVEE